MTNEEAARILDPATSAEALRPYALDCVMRMAVVEEACRMGAEALRASGWISVKARLPEAGKVLVTDGETVTISNGAWLYRSPEGKTRVPANYGAGLTVTHWMPLPKPPKEET